MTIRPITILAAIAIAITALSAPVCLSADLQSFQFLPVSTWTSNAIVMKFDGVGSIYSGRYKANLGSSLGIDIFCTDFMHRIHENEAYNTLANLGRVTDAALGAIPIGGEFYYAGEGAGGYFGGGLSSAMTALDYQPVGSMSAMARSAAVGYLGDLYLTGAATRTQLSAIQMAIWDICQDGGDGLSAGTVRATRALQSADGKAAFDLVDGYLASALANTRYIAQTTYWIQDGSKTLAVDQVSRTAHAQDFLYAGSPPVPEPFSLTLSGIGLAAVSALRRRSR